MEQAKLYEHRISLLLRFGVVASSILMAVGLLLAAFQPAAQFDHNPTLGELFRGFLSGDFSTASGSFAYTLILLGVLTLMFTPFLRVLAAMFAFMKERDWRFVGVATVVFLILVAQLVYSLQ